MKKTYFKPLVKIVNVEAESSLLSQSDIITPYYDVPDEYDDEGIGNGEGVWDF